MRRTGEDFGNSSELTRDYDATLIQGLYFTMSTTMQNEGA